MQREDFRDRPSAGSELALAELVYPVAEAHALASVEIVADVELGGLDQLLNR